MRTVCLLALTLLLVACGSHHDDGDDDRDHHRDHGAHAHETERSTPPHVREPEPPASDLAAGPPPLRRLTPAQAGTAVSRCDSGGGRECWLVGAMFERGEGRPADAAEARRFYERACALPGGFGCEDLARVDPAGAIAHLTVGCDAGRAPSCASLAQTTTDAEQSAQYIARACTLGNVEICIAARTAMHDVTPAPAGAPTEVSRLPSSVTETTVHTAAERCDEGTASMCAWLAMQYVEPGPFGVPVDEAHALDLSRRACNHEALGGCLLLGEILVVQQSDVATAGDAFNRSCAAGNAEACDAIAVVLSGLPEATDEIRLAQFEACILGLTEDCAS